VAGRFFYTAPLFAKSIKFMERFFQGTIHGNDDIKEADYLRLRLIVDEVHDETLFNPKQRREIWQAIHELLRSLVWKPKVDATLKKSHGKRGENLQRYLLDHFKISRILGNSMSLGRLGTITSSTWIGRCPILAVLQRWALAEPATYLSALVSHCGPRLSKGTEVEVLTWCSVHAETGFVELLCAYLLPSWPNEDRYWYSI
jgi:hypothetical protein